MRLSDIIKNVVVKVYFEVLKIVLRPDFLQILELAVNCYKLFSSLRV